MPTAPRIRTLTGNSVDVLNAIRNSASIEYRNYVPQATADADCIREIGGIMMDNPNIRNEFLNALINRIGLVYITSKLYDNPLRMFKKGKLELGETVEDIFADLARPFQYNPAEAEEKVFKREIPNVKATFYVVNYKTFYKTTIEEEELLQAFTSIEGVTNLITKLIEVLYTSANYDEFQVMKYMLAKRLLKGLMYPTTIPSVTASNMKPIVSSMKSVSNKLQFMNTVYNPVGVHNHAEKRDQFLITTAEFDASNDVEVLASAFNMSKAEFLGNRVLIDSFADLDIERLNVLFANDDTYVEFSADELEALASVPAVLVDRDFFMVFDKLNEMRTQLNGEGIYYNYWYHVWRTFAVSPYANAVAFIPEATGVNTVELGVKSGLAGVAISDNDSSAVTATLTMATASRKGTMSITPDVDADYFTPVSVTYLSDSDYVSVDASGKVTYNLPTTVVTDTTATVTVKSTYDTSKTATLTIVFDFA